MKQFDKNSERELSSRLRNHEFDFDPSAWDSMLNTLEQEEQKVKRGVWLRKPWLLACVFGASIGVASIAYNIHDKENKTELNLEGLKNEKIAYVENIHDNQLENISHISEAGAADKGIIYKEPQVEQPQEVFSIDNALVQEKDVVQATGSLENKSAGVDIANEREQNNSLPKVLEESHLVAEGKVIQEKLAIVDIKTIQTKTLESTSNHPIFSLGKPSILDWKKQKWSFNIKTGLSSKIYNHNLGTSFMPMLGLGIEYKFNAMHSLLTAIEYKSLSLGAVGKNVANTVQVLRMDCIELPLIYKMRLSTKTALLAGLKASYVVNTELAGVKGFTNEELKVNSFDAGMVFGAEYKLTSFLDLGLRYNLGLVQLSGADRGRLGLGWTEKSSQDEPLVVEHIKVSDQNVLKVAYPNKLYNNDLQLYVKYSF